jgi:hypothetical protein
MILIAKETLHMFMWFSDGSKIPSGISPLPPNTRLNYIKHLKEEFGKLFITKTPVYLFYMGRLLNKAQIALWYVQIYLKQIARSRLNPMIFFKQFIDINPLFFICSVNNKIHN